MGLDASNRQVSPLTAGFKTMVKVPQLSAHRGLLPIYGNRLPHVAASYLLHFRALVEQDRIELSTSTLSEWHSNLLNYCSLNGRNDRIRTCDLLIPNQARYQTALHSDGLNCERKDSNLQLKFCRLFNHKTLLAPPSP